MRFALFAAYCSTIPLANWFISHVGRQPFPGGPHTIPVGFGWSAPSGVLLIGLALVLRDFLQCQAGKAITLLAIAVGIGLSYTVNPAVATASALAFALSELLDFGVYTALERRPPLAVAASGIVGAFVDSLLFLWIAFGSVTFWQGQVFAKVAISVAVAGLLWAWRDLPFRRRTEVA